MEGDVLIRQLDKKTWAGFIGDNQITKPGCRACVLKMLKGVTAKSNKYKRIIIMNEDGTQEIHSTGVNGDGRQTQES
jgi:hypothetical protein